MRFALYLRVLPILLRENSRLYQGSICGSCVRLPIFFVPCSMVTGCFFILAMIKSLNIMALFKYSKEVL